jgi:hypothetical protein
MRSRGERREHRRLAGKLDSFEIPAPAIRCTFQAEFPPSAFGLQISP